MSSFSRSFKSSSYLSPCRRPPMPGRTFSNSSDRSITSDDGADRAASGQSTPTQAYQTRRYGPPAHQPGAAAAGPSTDLASAGRDSSASLSSSCRPIAIELPRAKKISSAPARTPPEQPLSARGDLPGGYFPMHEDPKERIYRPHPFHNESKASRVPHTTGVEGTIRERRAINHPQTTGTMATANVPVASYFPTGYRDNALPMGKYYPSNYESAQNQGSRPTSASPSSPAGSNSPGFSAFPNPPQQGASDADVRLRTQLQQYKRDMVAQASRAASEVLGTSDHNKESPSRFGPRGLKGFPGMEARFGGSSMHKPNAPRLHPLGSPGPVTPMELESSGSSYLDKDQGDGERSSQGLAPPGQSFTGRSL